MKSLLHILLATTMLFSTNCLSAVEDTVAGNISKLKARTGSHKLPDAQGVISFQLENTSLKDGCEWLFVKSTDQAATAVLLSARARTEKVTVMYYSDEKPEFSTNNCAAIIVSEGL